MVEQPFAAQELNFCRMPNNRTLSNLTHQKLDHVDSDYPNCPTETGESIPAPWSPQLESTQDIGVEQNEGCYAMQLLSFLTPNAQ